MWSCNLDLLAAFVLIVSPARPTEEENLKYAYLSPQIRLVGIQLELCTGKETWFDKYGTKSWENTDADWFHRVYVQSVDSPSIHWGQSYNEEEIARIHSGACRYLEFLENHASWLGWDNINNEMAGRIFRARDRVNLLQLYLWTVRESQIHYRRMKLKELLSAVGPEFFYSGRIPSFIPEEDLP